MTRDLADRFPDCQPYGGAFAEPTPHLTVIDPTRSRDASPTAHRDFLELADRSLPIDANLGEVRLISKPTMATGRPHRVPAHLLTGHAPLSTDPANTSMSPNHGRW